MTLVVVVVVVVDGGPGTGLISTAVNFYIYLEQTNDDDEFSRFCTSLCLMKIYHITT